MGCGIMMTLLTNYITLNNIRDTDKFIDNKVPCNLFKINLLKK